MIKPRIYQIKKRISAVPMYGGATHIALQLSGFNDVFISNVEPKITPGSLLKLNVLYGGEATKTPHNVIDDILIQFEDDKRLLRWYQHLSMCAPVNETERIDELRTGSFNYVLDKIGYPVKIWIYEVFE